MIGHQTVANKHNGSIFEIFEKQIYKNFVILLREKNILLVIPTIIHMVKPIPYIKLFNFLLSHTKSLQYKNEIFLNEG